MLDYIQWTLCFGRGVKAGLYLLLGTKASIPLTCELYSFTACLPARGKLHPVCNLPHRFEAPAGFGPSRLTCIYKSSWLFGSSQRSTWLPITLFLLAIKLPRNTNSIDLKLFLSHAVPKPCKQAGYYAQFHEGVLPLWIVSLGWIIMCPVGLHLLACLCCISSVSYQISLLSCYKTMSHSKRKHNLCLGRWKAVICIYYFV